MNSINHFTLSCQTRIDNNFFPGFLSIIDKKLHMLKERAQFLRGRAWLGFQGPRPPEGKAEGIPGPQSCPIFRFGGVTGSMRRKPSWLVAVTHPDPTLL